MEASQAPGQREEVKRVSESAAVPAAQCMTIGLASREGVADLTARVRLTGVAPRLLLTGPEIAHYTLSQFGGWQARKSVNAEPHSDAKKRYSELPPGFQEAIARMAEVRLSALATVFKPAALIALFELGIQLKATIDSNPDFLRGLPERIQGLINDQKPIVIQELEDTLNRVCGMITEPIVIGNKHFASWTEVLTEMHNGIWLSNLDKPHKHAFRREEMPTAPTAEFPDGQRNFSDKANAVNLVTGWFVSLADLYTTHLQERRSTLKSGEAPDCEPAILGAERQVGGVAPAGLAAIYPDSFQIIGEFDKGARYTTGLPAQ